MSKGNRSTPEAHLTDADFFTLALPPAGEPEALPQHLSECPACSRQFAEWRSAARALGNEGMDSLRNRSAADWEVLENRTIEAIRRLRRPSPRLWRWAVAVAASILLFALALPLWRGRTRPDVAPTVAQTLSAQDQADDALLRDVARLARSEDENSRLYREIAPEPSGAEEDRL